MVRVRHPRGFQEGTGRRQALDSSKVRRLEALAPDLRAWVCDRDFVSPVTRTTLAP